MVTAYSLELLGEVGEPLVPAAHHRAREHQAVTGVDLRETIEREVVLPAAHDRVGEHPGTREAAVDRELGRLRDQRRLFARFIGEHHALPGRLAPRLHKGAALVAHVDALSALRIDDPGAAKLLASQPNDAALTEWQTVLAQF